MWTPPEIPRVRVRVPRPQPDRTMVTGAVAATAGYLLPWFGPADNRASWFSGWHYAGHSGGGWTSLTLVWLAAAVIAAGWARHSAAAAMAGVVAVAGAGFFALAVVAASFASSFTVASDATQRGQLWAVTEPSLQLGLPLLALGLGVALAGGIRAITRFPAEATPQA